VTSEFRPDLTNFYYNYVGKSDYYIWVTIPKYFVSIEWQIKWIQVFDLKLHYTTVEIVLKWVKEFATFVLIKQNA